jgi:hypothetical protein
MAFCFGLVKLGEAVVRSVQAPHTLPVPIPAAKL